MSLLNLYSFYRQTSDYLFYFWFILIKNSLIWHTSRMIIIIVENSFSINVLPLSKLNTWPKSKQHRIFPACRQLCLRKWRSSGATQMALPTVPWICQQSRLQEVFVKIRIVPGSDNLWSSYHNLGWLVALYLYCFPSWKCDMSLHTWFSFNIHEM